MFLLKYKKKKGFTLIELIVGVVLLGIVSSLSTYLIINIFRNINESNSNITLNENFRNSMRMITSTVRIGRRLTFNIDVSGSNISFMDSIDSSQISFAYNTDDEKIIMNVDGTNSIIGKKITGFDIDAYDSTLQVISKPINNTNNDELKIIKISLSSYNNYNSLELTKRIKINVD